MSFDEFKTMRELDECLLAVEEPGAVRRILEWLVRKHAKRAEMGDVSLDRGQILDGDRARVEVSAEEASADVGNEIAGIAILEEDGRITFTIRDLKAKNANDAGIRLTLVAAYVHEQFTGKAVLPRKEILVPLLQDWRIYNGNIRKAIASHAGIVSVGRYELKLDSHAKADAKKIVAEILDAEVEGKWSPNAVGKKAKQSRKALAEVADGKEA